MQGSINRECTQVICFSDLLIEMLWKPPELLSVTVDKKSKPGDVYAFGIILSEIITRTLPYENYGYPAKGTLFFAIMWGCFICQYALVIAFLLWETLIYNNSNQNFISLIA